jgi:hypothetical protein
MTKNKYEAVIAISAIVSILLTSIAIAEDSLYWTLHPKKLHNRANELDEESEQAKKDGNDPKAFTKSLAAKKLREGDQFFHLTLLFLSIFP